MPWYFDLKNRQLSAAVRNRAVEGLQKLKAQLRDEVPRRNLFETLLLATWNIREFDSGKYGERAPEAMHYIAEIIDHFDLVAVQEVHADLSALKRVQSLLGAWWKYIVTDVTLGTSGNQERLAFLFDSRKVVFDGLAGELVLPDGKGERRLQFARTPFICGFKAGWTQFKLCTVHVYYGKGVAVDERRLQEIDELAKTLASVAKGDKRRVKSAVGGASAAVRTPSENLILLGDFNIFNRKDATFEALTKAGFVVPPSLDVDSLKDKLKGSNLAGDKHYDQIAFLAGSDLAFTDRAGIFDWQRSVFGRDEVERYADLLEPHLTKADGTAKDPKRTYNDWRTHQISDHLLMWAEFTIDLSGDYLKQVAG